MRDLLWLCSRVMLSNSVLNIDVYMHKFLLFLPLVREAYIWHGKWIIKRLTTDESTQYKKSLYSTVYSSISSSHHPRMQKRGQKNVQVSRKTEEQWAADFCCMHEERAAVFLSIDLKIKPFKIPAWLRPHPYQRSYWQLVAGEGAKVTLF